MRFQVGDPPRVLLVEDEPAHARMVEEAFREVDEEVEIDHVRTGEEAIEALAAICGQDPVSLPDLVILDMGLPGMDGDQVLSEVKAHPVLRRLPVVVFSGQVRPELVVRAYGEHGNCWIEKPEGFEGYVAVAELLSGFWMGTVQLPTRV